MCACSQASWRRRFRCILPQRLLLLFLVLCLWRLTRIRSPDLWPVETFDKCLDAPEAMHCLENSNRTSSSHKHTQNNSNIYYDNKVPSLYPKSTNASHNNSTSTTTISIPTTKGIQKHPNFTFDFPLCFVHVGKAAGSSVSCSLGLRYATCGGWMPRQPPLPWTRHFHMRKNNCGRDIATLLVTVRNPLRRIQSWFDFEKDILPTRRNKRDQDELRRKRGMLFQDCYHNFVDLVIDGLKLLPLSETSENNKTSYKVRSESPVDMTCQERAWAAVLGVREFSYHEWYNYEHYWTALRESFLDRDPRPSLLVLRTEHLSEDWSKLSKEDLFHQVNKGRTNSDMDLVTSNSTSILANSSTLSRINQKRVLDQHFWSNLCQALCPEIRIYQQILQHAKNLNLSQVEESMSEVQALCPLYDPTQTSCTGIPEFLPLRISQRQYLRETKKRLFVVV